jgi:hypothetical protein
MVLLLRLVIDLRYGVGVRQPDLISFRGAAAGTLATTELRTSIHQVASQSREHIQRRNIFACTGIVRHVSKIG